MEGRFVTYEEADASVGDGPFSHSITYYIGKRMTLDQWSDLDTAMDKALIEVFGEDAHEEFDIVGIAGPIPLDS